MTKLYQEMLKYPGDFEVVHNFVSHNSDEDIAWLGEKISKAINQYFDFEDATHVFTFSNGIIILSSMDGITAYSGMQVS